MKGPVAARHIFFWQGFRNDKNQGCRNETPVVSLRQPCYDKNVKKNRDELQRS